ncbi:MAG: DUF6677 family protein, partial [Planctomycetota bacterium]
MTSRERLIRVAGGLGLVAAGVAVYALSKSLDPLHRGVAPAIVCVVVGSTYLGQGLRRARRMDEPGAATGATERATILAAGFGMAALGVLLLTQVPAPDRTAGVVLTALLCAATGLVYVRASALRRVAPSDAAASPITTERRVFGFLLAWLVPGMGHWALGKRGKAALYFVAVSATFLAGALLAEGRNLNFDRDRIYFLAYMFNACETA